MSVVDTGQFRLSAQQERILSHGDWDVRRLCLVQELETLPPAAQLEAAVQRTLERHGVLRTEIRRPTGRREAFQSSLEVPTRPPVEHVAVPNGLDPDVEAERVARAAALDPAAGRVIAVADASGARGAAVAIAASSLVADAPSLGLILAELTGNKPEEQAVVNYTAYAGWQREQAIDGAWARWVSEAELRDLLDTVLPLTRREPGPGEHHRVSITGELGGVEPETLVRQVRAVWAAFLARWTGRTRVLLGHAVDGRTFEGLEHAVGPYTATLPLVIDVGTDVGTDTLATAVDRTVDELIAGVHAFTWTGLPEDLASRRMPFGFAVLPDPPAGVPGMRSAIDGLPEDVDIAVVVSGPVGQCVDLVHDPRAVSARRAADLAAQFGTMLEQALASPSTPPGQLPTSSNAVVTSPPVPGQGPRPVHEQIREHAAHEPERPAVLDSQTILSFGELVGRADELGERMHMAGVRPGVPVVCLIDRSANYTVVALACASVGAVFVPLDPGLAASRVADARSDGLATLVVTTTATHAVLPASTVETAPVLLVDNPATDPASVDVPEVTTGPDACYVMYTSGSTGEPKPVEVTFSGLAHYAEAMAHALELGRHDVVLHTAPLGFSSSIRQTLVALAAGATVVTASRDELTNPLRLLQRAARDGVTVLDLVPSHWRRVAQSAGTDPDIAARATGALRLLLSASEPLTGDTATAIETLRPTGATAVNMYGQTETTGIAVMTTLTSGHGEGHDLIPLGTPLPGITILVRDERGTIAPSGVRGTLHVAGPTVGAGYPGRDADTFARFDYTEVDGRLERVYDTGDVGIIDVDGQVHFLGRTDGQVQVRGFRVELAEAEAGLMRHPAVREAAVVARNSGGDDVGLQGFVIPHRDQRPTHSDLVSYLSERIAAYLIPDRFQLVTELPTTDNGKIDRAALTEAARSDGRARAGSSPPQTETERALAAVWVEVLAVPEVGSGDNFFELGGNSLLGIDMITKVTERLGVAVPWTEIFENPTLGELARRLDRDGWPEQGASA